MIENIDCIDKIKHTTSSKRKPTWLRRPIITSGGKYGQVKKCFSSQGLHTVCSEAKCPNRSECFSAGTATFLIMGAKCTRNCTFCSITKGTPDPIDRDEINRVVEASRAMRLKHIVITSVTRDDLPDGGAAFFADTVAAIRSNLEGVTIELLIPDLKGDEKALQTVVESRPDIINHNIETVPSLYREIRPQADYKRSIFVLQYSAQSGIITKSGFMVGLGETSKEVFAVLDDLQECGCKIVTIGQYLQPTALQTVVKEYIFPQKFVEYAEYGRKAGIREVFAGPFVRSSYHAADFIK